MTNPDKKYTVEGPIAGTKPLTMDATAEPEKPVLVRETLPKHIPPLASQDFCMLGQVNIDFNATPQAGLTMKDILNPSYWRTVTSQLRVGCEVRVIPEDNAWYAKLLVLACDKFSANMALIQFSDLRQKAVVTIEQFDVRPTQNNTRYGVFRKADGQVLKQGFVTEKQAADYLNNYVTTMAT